MDGATGEEARGGAAGGQPRQGGSRQPREAPTEAVDRQVAEVRRVKQDKNSNIVGACDIQVAARGGWAHAPEPGVRSRFGLADASPAATAGEISSRVSESGGEYKVPVVQLTQRLRRLVPPTNAPVAAEGPAASPSMNGNDTSPARTTHRPRVLVAPTDATEAAHAPVGAGSASPSTSAVAAAPFSAGGASPSAATRAATKREVAKLLRTFVQQQAGGALKGVSLGLFYKWIPAGRWGGPAEVQTLIKSAGGFKKFVAEYPDLLRLQGENHSLAIVAAGVGDPTSPSPPPKAQLLQGLWLTPGAQPLSPAARPSPQKRMDESAGAKGAEDRGGAAGGQPRQGGSRQPRDAPAEAVDRQVAEMRWVKPDKNGNIVGACDIQVAARGGGQGAGSVFIFHGSPAHRGFKCGGNPGNVESAGLPLAPGDTLFQIHTRGGKKAGEVQLVSGTILAPRADAKRFDAYLSGLAARPQIRGLTKGKTGVNLQI
ncbi:hypothetical protein T484DRAFT_1781997 [Baffinella frigidus]|nr:hypothetical protein T484DRAFT_1781997 [Cryptophyta sp. CCMP2293]